VTGAPFTVGFVGLGAMGAPMAARVVAAPHRLFVWNRSPAAAHLRHQDGAEITATPGDLAEKTDLVLGCLLDGPAIEQVYLGPQGLVQAARPGQVFVEHGTFAPQLARRLAAALAERGAVFLDAPVTGGPDGARAGTLTAMVGGQAESLAHAAPVLRHYTAHVLHIGGPGAGLELKLVNQMLVSAHVAAAAEAAAVLRARRIPLEAARKVLGSGWAASTMLERTLTRLLARDTEASGATIGGLLEPQRLARELAAQAGTSLPLLTVVSELFAHALDLGLASHDLAALTTAVGRPADHS
jgi:3-hydroxyisobutyrate dehydrogenase-like beta-hydroxyacid dehydrogenase